MKKKEKWFETFWFRFIIGGFIIAGTSSLAVNVSPKAGAIFWSAPFSLVPTLLYFWDIKMSPSKVYEFAKSTVISLLNLMAFVFSFAVAVHLNAFKGENAILYAMLVGFGVWSLGSSILYFYG